MMTPFQYDVLRLRSTYKLYGLAAIMRLARRFLIGTTHISIEEARLTVDTSWKGLPTQRRAMRELWG